MMKTPFRAKFTRLSSLVVFLFFYITGEYAVAESASGEKPVYMPVVNDRLDINLNNLFRNNYLRQAPEVSNLNKPEHADEMPMHLVGTLIMNKNKLAWIRTVDDEIHVLEHGQRVPGSVFRIDKIDADSVGLVNSVKCGNHDGCKFRLVLDLN